jgi:hypothetical protein
MLIKTESYQKNQKKKLTPILSELQFCKKIRSGRSARRQTAPGRPINNTT